MGEALRLLRIFNGYKSAESAKMLGWKEQGGITCLLILLLLQK